MLEEDAGKLVSVGRVGGLGKGERIYAVRFMDDAAYVVTFRQVDPSYIVDLSAPRRPRVAGELKIQGYSSYLHPIGDDLVLGVGQEAPSAARRSGPRSRCSTCRTSAGRPACTGARSSRAAPRRSSTTTPPGLGPGCEGERAEQSFAARLDRLSLSAVV